MTPAGGKSSSRWVRRSIIAECPGYAPPAVRFYSPVDIKALWVLSSNGCGYPGCDEVLSDRSWKQVNAEIAHIYGERPGAPRFEKNMSDAQRNGRPNLFLLCPNHHTLIDSLVPDEHPAEKLLEMKSAHESRASEHPPWASEPEIDRLSALLVEASGAVMVDWLSDEDSVEIWEIKHVRERRTPARRIARPKTENHS
jgi:hypothetical protein